jgi:hypothetical protein
MTSCVKISSTSDDFVKLDVTLLFCGGAVIFTVVHAVIIVFCLSIPLQGNVSIHLLGRCKSISLTIVGDRNRLDDTKVGPNILIIKQYGEIILLNVR